MLHRLAPLPFLLSSAVPDGAREAIAAAALRANDRYVIDFLEEHNFCPYARAGRERGATERVVHFADSPDASAVAGVFERAAPGMVEVIQIIFPLVAVSAEDFSRFVNDVTEALNRTQERAVFASAALHPELPYRRDSATGLISLFRRAPDPTLQWVRLATLDNIYRGRKVGTSFVDLSNLRSVLDAPAKRDLYNEIAAANREAAEGLGIEAIEGRLRGLRDEAQREYRAILAAI
jgi:hypothetical protein